MLRRFLRQITICSTGMILIMLWQARAQEAPTVKQAPSSSSYVGNEPCARCHASIAQTYARTAMAHANVANRVRVVPVPPIVVSRGLSKAPSSARRTSPMSRRRCFGSF